MKLSRRGGRGLEELARGLRELANGAHQPGIQKAMGDEAVKQTRQAIETGESPDGEPWPKRADGEVALRGLAEGVDYKALPPYPFESSVEVRVHHWTAHFAQGGTRQHGKEHNPQRALVPDADTPAEWADKVFAKAEGAFDSSVRRAMKGK